MRPALVASLLGRDEHTVHFILPVFQHLEPVAEPVADALREQFDEPNPLYAARAVVALIHLGRADPELALRCREVLTDTTGAWGWAVPPEVGEYAARAAATERPFAATWPRVAEHVRELLFAHDSPEEQAISDHVRPAEGAGVGWSDVFGCVAAHSEGGLLLLALMCGFGSRGFNQKMPLIKYQRAAAGTGLSEAKGIVERVIEVFGRGATPAERCACVRAYFGTGAGVTLPLSVVELLGHRISWYRWAGLELLDAWGAPGVVPELIGARRWDRSELVRRRARQMVNG